MRKFPVTAAMLIVLGGVLPLLAGGWIFLAGVLIALPHLSLVLLAYGGCLLSFYGAVHWGFLACKPTLILPTGEKTADQRLIILGVMCFLWSWLALCIGVLVSLRAGYAMEGVGFAGLFLAERIVNRYEQIPPGYLVVKAVGTALCLFGFFLAFLSPQGQF